MILSLRPHSDLAERTSAAAATLFNQTGRRRGSLMDCMIAATAIESGDELVTANQADFKRFEKFGRTVI